ncbi:MAG: hypothetical protein Q8Q00_07430 [Dehalococcoidia bacterium]|nr:hypothetical protein [Dehalococcoidia bacterium]
MGRTLIYLSILVLAVFVLAAAFLLQTGGESLSSPAAVPVSVHDLSVAPQAHDDERVVATGVLRLIHEPNDHFLVTEEGLGVIVRGYDEGALRALDGQAVTVTGRFGFDGETGTYIDAESVTAAP